VCIAALALICGSAIAIWQALEARSAQRIAEQRFADLNGFARSVILDYPKLQNMKGETQAREFLTKTTLQYLDGMAKDTRGLDLKILENLALAYSATGDILGRPNMANLGDPKASLESYQKSVALFDDLVARDPDNIKFKRNLAITCERIGNLYIQDQQFDQALVVFRKSHSLKLAVADKHEMGPRDLSFSFNKLGDAYIKLGRMEEAYDMYVQSLDIRKRLAEQKPEDGEIQRGYTVGLNRVADVLLELHRNAEALDLCEASLLRRVDQAKSQPDNTQAAMDLAMGHLKRAQVLARVDRLDESLPAFESARAILHRMADTDPSNTTAWAGAAEVSGEMGRVLFEAGRLDAALPELTACTQELERGMSVDKMAAGMREQLASGYHRRGQTHLALAHAKHATAEQSYKHESEGCASLCRALQLYLSLEGSEKRVPPELPGELAKCSEHACPTP
jgi:tetratricopeptide (TPR) repeat protein